MTPDLGKYALTVLSAYGATILALAVLVLATVVRSRRVRAALDAAEKRAGNG